MIAELIYIITPREVSRIEVAGPGTPGTPGTKWYNGVDNPEEDTGIVGDYYLNNTTNEYFEKTDYITWTSRGTMGSSVVDWSDIQNKPAAFPPQSHEHAVAEITDLQNLLDQKQNIDAKNVPDGYAGLGGDGKILNSLLPAIAITDTFEVASQAEMLALDVERGDVAVRSDEQKSYILKSEPASVLANWVLLLTPTNGVISVNGQTGVVTLLTTHIAEGTNQYFTVARVLSTTLTGFIAGSNIAVAATDTILQAFAKVQGQINARFLANGGDLTGTNGAGYIGLTHQASAPATPVSGVRIWGSTGALSFKTQDGKVREFTGGLSSDRQYILPDQSGTIALAEQIPDLIPEPGLPKLLFADRTEYISMSNSEENFFTLAIDGDTLQAGSLLEITSLINMDEGTGGRRTYIVRFSNDIHPNSGDIYCQVETIQAQPHSAQLITRITFQPGNKQMGGLINGKYGVDLDNQIAASTFDISQPVYLHFSAFVEDSADKVRLLAVDVKQFDFTLP